MAVIATLQSNVTARTRNFEKGMRRSRRALQGYTRGARAAAIATQAANLAVKQFLTLVAPLAVFAGFLKLAGSAEKFNQSMLSSIAIMGDLSEAMKRDMQEVAIETAAVTRFSADEIAKSFFFLASAGLDAAASIKALPAVAKFAQAGMFDMALATDLLTDAQSALGKSSKDATENLAEMVAISDILVKANTVANASVEQFSTALTTKAGAAIKFLNKSTEEGVAVLAAFADQGIKAQEAGTALNIVLRDLSTKAIRNKQAFREAGLAVFGAGGQMRNVADIIGDIEVLLGGMSDQLKKSTLLQLGFADKSITFIQALIGSSEKIRQFEKDLRSAGGITEEIANKQLTIWAKASASMGAAFTKIGQVVKPVLDGISLAVLGLGKSLQFLADLTSNIIGFASDSAKSLNEMADAAATAEKEILSLNFVLAGAEKALRGPGVRQGERQRGPLALTERFRKAGEELRQSLITPGDKLGQGLRLIDQLFIRGAISLEEFNEGTKRLWKTFQDGSGITAATKNLKAFAQGVKDEIMTPMEKFQTRVARLIEALTAGDLTFDQYKRALDGAIIQRNAATEAGLPPTARFQQVDLSRVSVAGLRSQRQVQTVKDPALLAEAEKQTAIMERQPGNLAVVP